MSFKLKVALAGIVALIVFIVQLFIKNIKDYWLNLFILSLPLAAQKIIGNREAVLEVMNKHGVPAGSFPVLNFFFSDILLAVLFALWIFDLYVNRNSELYFPKIARYAAAFIAWAGLSLINSEYLSYSIFEFIRIIKFFLIYLFFINNIKSKKQLKLIISLLAFGVFIQGIICFVQYKYQITLTLTGMSYGSDVMEDKTLTMEAEHDSDGGSVRGTGTVGPHNAQAMYFEVTLPLLISIIFYYIKRFVSLFYWLAFFSGAIGLYTTISRGGTIGTAIGIFTLLGFLMWENILPKYFSLIFLLIVLTIGISYYDKIDNFLNKREGTFNVRLEMNKVGMKMIMDRPILGFGLNSSVTHLEDYDDQNVTIGYPVHNHYIMLASEIGILGLIFFLIFFVKSALTALTISPGDDRFFYFVATGIVSSFLGASVHMGWDMFGNEVIQTLLWIYAALIISMKRISFNSGIKEAVIS